MCSREKFDVNETTKRGWYADEIADEMVATTTLRQDHKTSGREGDEKRRFWLPLGMNFHISMAPSCTFAPLSCSWRLAGTPPVPTAPTTKNIEEEEETEEKEE